MPGYQGGGHLRIEVLGRLRVLRGGTAVDLGTPQQRAVLAVLILHANRPLGREKFINAVWGLQAPEYAVNLLQKHVSRLRKSLAPPAGDPAGPDLVTWTDAGYVFTVRPGELDLDDFEREVDQAAAARAAGDLPKAAQALRTASELWRGPLCDGLTGPFLEAYRDRLAERRVGVLEEQIELELSIGDGADLVGQLRDLVAEHPLRERLRGLLMLALYRSQRQADALAAYHDTRQYLLEELGIEPAARLRQLYQRMLSADPALMPGTGEPVTAPPDPVSVAVPVRSIPAQLPHRVAHFVGREDQLAQLRRLRPGDSGSPALVVITGTAGVGKTTLAVHWAHQVRDQFPDGQLYVNLRGFDAAGTRVEPSDALMAFLNALGVPTIQIPPQVDARAALFRSVLSDRRVLVVLDNAGTAEQVRPLLPASDGCLTIVTSRNWLNGLVAVDGAERLNLDLFNTDEARQMLSRRLGDHRLSAEPDAVEEMLASCAGLPLALTIVAARAAFYSAFPLAVLAGQLPAHQAGLDAFRGDDQSTDLRAVISWSYRVLEPGPARLFRLMGGHPGPDITIAAAASLLGENLATAGAALTALATAHLVDERTPGRYSFHDLLRAFAIEEAEVVESDSDRQAALQRVLYHYLRTAQYADLLISPDREPLATVPPVEGAVVAGPADEVAALSWFAAELPVLLASVDLPHRTRLDAVTSRLVWGLGTFLDRRGHWHERRYDEGYTGYRELLEHSGRSGDQSGQAHVHFHLTWVLERQGKHREALAHAQQAATLFTESGSKGGLADCLNAIGWCYAQLGDTEHAIANCSQALVLHRQAGHRAGEAHTLDSLGYAHQRLGKHDKAVLYYGRAVELWSELGVPFYEADTLTRVGDAHHANGDLGLARDAWRRALLVFEGFGHPGADEIRSKLDDVKGGDS
ncbi:DNA-binding SARP family transcriptional activator/tetratricopeptide (TPR) repeat protein [Kibdelosporangium banguiense]|uniref:DNA-binding SARP family transcriptional activator/tetratricopeptide (TPR) repeat protein n=1 Tax=Kibdelosporangium banguiense TaxID=1365924 RepID=A0ABS4TVH8_9PSEU|nr:BTAD domain-containing putative transcriptional regulator [Kibdelosporangium banguiense]MBP2328416.1 DNA-binding SARP family transcriptional activator/tetratricopeptide (TPR) repeat protein [Kibdelosporangium banguiense]